MDRFLRYRWQRALQYKGRDFVSARLIRDVDTNEYKASANVVSSTGGKWETFAALAGNKLVFAKCNCPDYGTVQHNGQDICKHTLALALAVHLAANSVFVRPSETLKQARARAAA